MLKLCLPSSHSIFSLSLTPNTSNCLQPASSVYVCVCVYVLVCLWGLMFDKLMTHLCIIYLLILCVLVSVANMSMKWTCLGLI